MTKKAQQFTEIKMDEYPKWLVICLDDEERYTMATHRYFATQDMAIAYTKTIASGRCPFAVEVLRPIREDIA